MTKKIKELRKTLSNQKRQCLEKSYEALNIIGTAVQPMRVESLEDKKFRNHVKESLQEGLKIIELLENMPSEKSP